MLLLAWRAGREGNDADLGDKAEAVSHFIEAKFATDVARIAMAIGACAVGVGIFVGLVAYLLVRVRGAHRKGFARFALESFVVTVLVHALFSFHAMARTPQLYAAHFYARGGLRRTLQIFATDLLGENGVLLLGVLLVALYVAGPGAERSFWPRSRAFLLSLRAKVTALRAGRGAVLGSFVLFGFSGGSRVEELAPGEATLAKTGALPVAAPGRSSGNEPPMNVLVLAADSLRADRLDPRTAPRLSELAERSVRFDRAYVSVPRTFSSWVDILTGRHAHHHGVRSMFPRWEDRAKDFDALPGRFAKAGYHTEVVGDYAADIFGRVDLGFARVDTPSFDFRQLLRQRGLERETPLLPFLHSHRGRTLFPVLKELADAADAELLADDTVAALTRLRERPFFLTVFFSTAHFPYAAPAPYYRTFTDPAYRGRYKYHKPVGLGGELGPDEADVRQIRGLYDGAVRSIDAAMGRVLAQLEALGLADKTLVVVTADHGETLYENGHGQGHGDHLFGDEGTHVPLLVHDPRLERRGLRIPDVVRDVDIAPTLYALAGVAAPADLDGRSLAGAMRGKPLDPAFAYAETELWFTEDIQGLSPRQRLPYPGIMQMTELDTAHGLVEIVLQKAMVPTTLVARHRMIRDQRWKLVYVPTRRGAEYMLFDTVADPGETRDVSREHGPEVERLKAPLWKWMLEDRNMVQKDGLLVPRDQEGP